MELLAIESTEETPQVNFNPATGVFEITGRSIIDDAASFYAPIQQWLIGYLRQPHTVTELTIKLDYLNTSSSKAIFDILASLEDIEGVKVNWCYREDNEEMEEAGEEFSELVRIPFDLKPY